MIPERIVILGRQEDPSARAIADRWAAHGARLLTPAGLLVRGWRHDPQDPSHDLAIIEGDVWPSSTITGVVTRLTAVVPSDLGPIRAVDRAYVATEINAFLLSWLSSLRCPVINRPSPWSLAGPALSHDAWARLAARLKIPVEPIERDLNGMRSDSISFHSSVTVVGHEMFGDVHDVTIADYARRLADESQTELLEIDFASGPEGARFWTANPIPRITEPRAAALLRYLRRTREGA